MLKLSNFSFQPVLFFVKYWITRNYKWSKIYQYWSSRWQWINDHHRKKMFIPMQAHEICKLSMFHSIMVQLQRTSADRKEGKKHKRFIFLLRHAYLMIMWQLWNNYESWSSTLQPSQCCIISKLWQEEKKKKNISRNILHGRKKIIHKIKKNTNKKSRTFSFFSLFLDYESKACRMSGTQQ